MNLLKEVIKNEVYPAFGCTEPISVAYASSNAASLIKKLDLNNLTAEINLDPATYKNGYAVSLPSIKKYRGNLIAAAIGIVKAKPELKNKIFEKVTSEEIKKAISLIKNGKISLNVDYTKKDIYIEVIIKVEKETSVCVIENSHFNISFLALNDKIIKSNNIIKKTDSDYREIIKNLDIDDMIKLAENADTKILRYIEKGIHLNMRAAQKGKKLKKLSYHLDKIQAKYSSSRNGIIAKIQKICAAATDARMSGADVAVMSSGESGNQGVIAILVPYLLGKEKKIKRSKILKAIALSHLINSYIKAYTGMLSSMCGCSVSSAAAASAAIVYMMGFDSPYIKNAINSVIADIGGMICDGAKESCSLKVATASEVAVRTALLTIEGYSTDISSGFIGDSLKQTVSNTARISVTGMSHVDSVTIDIMKNKKFLNV